MIHVRVCRAVIPVWNWYWLRYWSFHKLHSDISAITRFRRGQCRFRSGACTVNVFAALVWNDGFPLRWMKTGGIIPTVCTYWIVLEIARNRRSKLLAMPSCRTWSPFSGEDVEPVPRYGITRLDPEMGLAPADRRWRLHIPSRPQAAGSKLKMHTGSMVLLS